MAADVATRGGDVGRAGDPVEAGGEVVQGGHEGGARPGADLGVVLGEDDVADVVQPVLDAPGSADRIGDLIGPEIWPGHVGDRVRVARCNARISCYDLTDREQVRGDHSKGES